ncbi:MAG: addiction module protein [Hyphomicrobiales bacterium]|nr:addiction module protein [Hyphomicrobiales bacterium]
MNRPTFDELRAMSIEERLQLLDDIWATLDEREVAAGPATAREKQILDERLKAFEENPQDTLTWDEVKRNVLRPR